MKCKVEDCENDATYIQQCVCQKHYFRMMRYGTYETTRVGKGTGRTHNSKGYQMLKLPEHPLAMVNGFVYEHRKVIHDQYGDDLPPCEKCGKIVTWKTAHIDHIDEIINHNESSNLRVLCRACNVMRSRVHIPEHTKKGRTRITFDGVTKTASEWSRDPRVTVASTTILFRLRKGMSPESALFSPKVTHRHTKAKTKPPAYGEYQGPRSEQEDA
ncbi:HNH endonuclease [Escherichia coli]|nr:HNH endonuclease [Escherichia coli]